jgi:hypothetical protein
MWALLWSDDARVSGEAGRDARCLGGGEPWEEPGRRASVDALDGRCGLLPRARPPSGGAAACPGPPSPEGSIRPAQALGDPSGASCHCSSPLLQRNALGMRPACARWSGDGQWGRAGRERARGGTQNAEHNVMGCERRNSPRSELFGAFPGSVRGRHLARRALPAARCSARAPPAALE